MKIFNAKPLHQHHFHSLHFGFIDYFFVKRESQQAPNFHRRMFDEDFSMLFSPRDSRSESLFDIVSNDYALTQRLLGNVKTGYEQYTIDETIRELLEEVTQSLIRSGRAFYSLYDDLDKEETHIVSFSSNGVVRLLGTQIHWIPRRRERHLGQDGEELLPREVRILDSKKVMRFDMPKSIKRMLSIQNKTLSVLDKHKLGSINFQSQATYENPNPSTHFDFRAWNDIQERALCRATRSTGWNGRKYDSPNSSDFFYCHRLIRFRRNQLLLRDDILNQLSRELSRVGKSYKVEFSVKILGSNELPSITHLNELEDRLEREQLGFTEIIDYCSNR